ncbi:hypothetical protein Tcan_04168 [Toxocara canis]|uniref:Uncharacterized protein n=1 Tax=Toxocara canis TaxID=6265 RepID=A0A0B2VVB3_TOXCA|nr:hypothetical protein Tcan_04168 [Toxocara canis]
MLLLLVTAGLLLNVVQKCDATTIFSSSNSQQNAIITSGNISCIVSNGELYVNGKHKGQLTTVQKEEFDKYTKGLDLWGTELHRCIQQEMEASMKRMMRIQKAISKIFDQDGLFSSHFTSFHNLIDDDEDSTNDTKSEHNKVVKRNRTAMSTNQSPHAKRQKLSSDADALSDGTIKGSAEEVKALQSCCLLCGCTSIALKPNAPRRKGRPISMRHRCTNCRKFTGDTFVQTTNGVYVVHKIDPKKYAYQRNELTEKDEGSGTTLMGTEGSSAEQSGERQPGLKAFDKSHVDEQKSEIGAGPRPLKIKIAGGRIVESSVEFEPQKFVVVDSIASGSKEEVSQLSDSLPPPGDEETACSEEAEVLAGSVDERVTVPSEIPENTNVATVSTREGSRRTRSARMNTLVAGATDASLETNTGGPQVRSFKMTAVVADDTSAHLTTVVDDREKFHCRDVAGPVVESASVLMAVSADTPPVADTSAIPELVKADPSVSVITSVNAPENGPSAKQGTSDAIVLDEKIESSARVELVPTTTAVNDAMILCAMKEDKQLRDNKMAIELAKTAEVVNGGTATTRRTCGGRRRRPLTMRKQTGGRISSARRASSSSAESDKEGSNEVSDNNSTKLQRIGSASDVGRCAPTTKKKDSMEKTGDALTNCKPSYERKATCSRNASSIIAIQVCEGKDDLKQQKLSKMSDQQAVSSSSSSSNTRLGCSPIKKLKKSDLMNVTITKPAPSKLISSAMQTVSDDTLKPSSKPLVCTSSQTSDGNLTEYVLDEWSRNDAFSFEGKDLHWTLRRLKMACVIMRAQKVEMEKLREKNRLLKELFNDAKRAVDELKKTFLSELSRIRGDVSSMSTEFRLYHLDLKRGCDTCAVKAKEDTQRFELVASKYEEDKRKLKEQFEAKEQELSVCRAIIDSKTRDLLVADRDLHLANERVISIQKKLEDKLFVATNTKCTSCSVFDKYRDVLTTQIADKTTALADANNVLNEVRVKLKKQERAARILSKENEKTKFERDAWMADSKRLENEVKSLRMRLGASGGEGSAVSMNNASTPSDSSGSAFRFSTDCRPTPGALEARDSPATSSSTSYMQSPIFAEKVVCPPPPEPPTFGKWSDCSKIKTTKQVIKPEALKNPRDTLPDSKCSTMRDTVIKPEALKNPRDTLPDSKCSTMRDTVNGPSYKKKCANERASNCERVHTNSSSNRVTSRNRVRDETLRMTMKRTRGTEEEARKERNKKRSPEKEASYSSKASPDAYLERRKPPSRASTLHGDNVSKVFAHIDEDGVTCSKGERGDRMKNNMKREVEGQKAYEGHEVGEECHSKSELKQSKDLVPKSVMGETKRKLSSPGRQPSLENLNSSQREYSRDKSGDERVDKMKMSIGGGKNRGDVRWGEEKGKTTHSARSSTKVALAGGALSRADIEAHKDGKMSAHTSERFSRSLSKKVSSVRHSHSPPFVHRSIWYRDRSRSPDSFRERRRYSLAAEMSLRSRLEMKEEMAWRTRENENDLAPWTRISEPDDVTFATDPFCSRQLATTSAEGSWSPRNEPSWRTSGGRFASDVDSPSRSLRGYRTPEPGRLDIDVDRRRVERDEHWRMMEDDFAHRRFLPRPVLDDAQLMSVASCSRTRSGSGGVWNGPVILPKRDALLPSSSPGYERRLSDVLLDPVLLEETVDFPSPRRPTTYNGPADGSRIRVEDIPWKTDWRREERWRDAVEWYTEAAEMSLRSRLEMKEEMAWRTRENENDLAPWTRISEPDDVTFATDPFCSRQLATTSAEGSWSPRNEPSWRTSGGRFASDVDSPSRSLRGYRTPEPGRLDIDVDRRRVERDEHWRMMEDDFAHRRFLPRPVLDDAQLMSVASCSRTRSGSGGVWNGPVILPKRDALLPSSSPGYERRLSDVLLDPVLLEETVDFPSPRRPTTYNGPADGSRIRVEDIPWKTDWRREERWRDAVEWYTEESDSRNLDRHWM